MSLLFSTPQQKSGEVIIRAMHDRYSSTWYKTLTLTQTTRTHKADGSTQEEVWQEYMKIPAKLRIDVLPVDSGNCFIFIRDSIFVYQQGRLSISRPQIHRLLLLAFDVYHAPVEETIRKLRELRYDLSVVREDTWQGRPVYVVGAQQGDSRSRQFWIDKERLVFVRSLEQTPRDSTIISEVQFNKYEKQGGGWISPYVVFIVGGKTVTEEFYANIKTDVMIADNMFEPKR